MALHDNRSAASDRLLTVKRLPTELAAEVIGDSSGSGNIISKKSENSEARQLNDKTRTKHKLGELTKQRKLYEPNQRESSKSDAVNPAQPEAMRDFERLKTRAKETLSGSSDEIGSERDQAQVLSSGAPEPEMTNQEYQHQSMLNQEVASNAANQQQHLHHHHSQSVTRLKQHRPHCIHHSQNCQRHQQQPQSQPANNLNHHQHHNAESAYELNPQAGNKFHEQTKQPLKYIKQPDKYLLVEYRQGEFHPVPSRGQQHDSQARQLRQLANNGRQFASAYAEASDTVQCTAATANTNKRTTIKFVSQLYFLLHLSAILSLLLHHKNLVSSERKQTAYSSSQATAASTASTTITTPDYDFHSHSAHSRQLQARQHQQHVKKHTILSNDTQQYLPRAEESLIPINPLPVPQMLQQIASSNPNSLRPAGSRQIGSVLVQSPSNKSGQSNQQQRFGRQTQPPLVLGAAATGGQDILVELVGYWHAKCALQYFLCYLLLSSVAILIALRLSRMCNSGGQTSGPAASAGASKSSANLISHYGFYYRTRLDCTPVLIGSISLGLIQLIVIGLDVANNIDWLSSGGAGESRWPIYLPILQFVFVSLLMQFILGKVAKNQEQKESGSVSSAARRQPNLSINNENRMVRRGNSSGNNGGLLIGSKRIVGGGAANESSPLPPPISNGLQNIALAHLLVTHILLWLMKLNSISLFQPIEFHQTPPTSLAGQQHLANLVSSAPASGRSLGKESLNQQLHTGNVLVDNGLAFPETVASVLIGGPTTTDESADDSDPTGDDQKQLNRTELESILRRKSATGHEASTKVEATKPNDLGSSANLNATTKNDTAVVTKNERGLRSTAQTSSRPIVVDQESRVSAEGDRVTSAISDLVKLKSLNDTTISMSHSQLMSLLNMAAKSQKISFSNPQHQQQDPEALLPVVGQPGSGATAQQTIFKSSLPKRMTAFRQANNVSGKNSTSHNLNHLAKMTTTTTASPSITTVIPLKKYKAIVTVKQDDDSATDDEQQEPDEDNQGGSRKARKTKSSPKERPFPSIEPPGREKAAAASQTVLSKTTKSSDESRTLKVGIEPSKKAKLRDRAQTMKTIKEQTTIATTTILPTTTRSKRINDADEANMSLDDNELEDDSSSTTQDSSGDAFGDSTDGPETDLDAMLPPVPDYNETTSDKEETVASKQDLLMSRKPKALNLDNKPGKLYPTKDESLAFNEAASSIETIVTPSPTVNKTNTITNETIEIKSRAPNNVTTTIGNSTEKATINLNELKKEALVMVPTLHNQPIFADFLLPIVYQYHILIIAILFNMWLDGLKSGSSSNNGVEVNRRIVEYSPQQVHGRHHRVVKLKTGNDASNLLLNTSGSSGSDESEYKYLAQLQKRRANLNRGHNRSKSVNSLHLADEDYFNSENMSTFSRHNSLRSSSSRQLLWIPSSQLRSPLLANHIAKQRFTSHQITPESTTINSSSGLSSSEAGGPFGRRHRACRSATGDGSDSHSVCSVFFGLLIVSASLIVILLGIELLSIITQCLAQFISILVCFLGLCFIWHGSRRSNVTIKSRIGRRKNDNFTMADHGNHYLNKQSSRLQVIHKGPRRPSPQTSTKTASHRQCFHYLFLLAAYYCGISIALNLTKQFSVQQLFTQQVIQFCQRHLGHWFFRLQKAPNLSDYQQFSNQYSATSLPLADYLLLFHIILAIKGLLLILQVTLQTVLIRSSCQKATKDLRQIYTFLMFANLSLWAMEICEQQQQLQRDFNSDTVTDKFKLITLDSFTRFAASIVTLSHLYHGLVFMQH